MMEERLLALEAMNAERERERGRWKKARKMTRSNMGIRAKARVSRPIKIIQAWIENMRKRKPRYNALPANMRPWVPHRRRLIASGDWQQLAAYARELRALCTEKQWLDIQGEYFGRLTA